MVSFREVCTLHRESTRNDTVVIFHMASLEEPQGYEVNVKVL